MKYLIFLFFTCSIYAQQNPGKDHVHVGDGVYVPKSTSVDFDGVDVNASLVRPSGSLLTDFTHSNYYCDRYRTPNLDLAQSYALCSVINLTQGGMLDALKIRSLEKKLHQARDEFALTNSCPKSHLSEIYAQLPKEKDIRTQEQGNMTDLIVEAFRPQDPQLEFHLPVSCGENRRFKSFYTTQFNCINDKNCYTQGFYNQPKTQSLYTRQELSSKEALSPWQWIFTTQPGQTQKSYREGGEFGDLFVYPLMSGVFLERYFDDKTEKEYQTIIQQGLIFIPSEYEKLDLACRIHKGQYQNSAQDFVPSLVVKKLIHEALIIKVSRDLSLFLRPLRNEISNLLSIGKLDKSQKLRLKKLQSDQAGFVLFYDSLKTHYLQELNSSFPLSLSTVSDNQMFQSLVQYAQKVKLSLNEKFEESSPCLLLSKLPQK